MKTKNKIWVLEYRDEKTHKYAVLHEYVSSFPTRNDARRQQKSIQASTDLMVCVRKYVQAQPHQ